MEKVILHHLLQSVQLPHLAFGSVCQPEDLFLQLGVRVGGVVAVQKLFQLFQPFLLFGSLLFQHRKALFWPVGGVHQPVQIFADLAHKLLRRVVGGQLVSLADGPQSRIDRGLHQLPQDGAVELFCHGGKLFLRFFLYIHAEQALEHITGEVPDAGQLPLGLLFQFAQHTVSAFSDLPVNLVLDSPEIKDPVPLPEHRVQMVTEEGRFHQPAKINKSVSHKLSFPAFKMGRAEALPVVTPQFDF